MKLTQTGFSPRSLKLRVGDRLVVTKVTKPKHFSDGSYEQGEATVRVVRK